MKTFLAKLDKILDVIEENVVGYSIILMIIIMFVNVILRFCFKSALKWGDELCRYLNIVIVYMAVAAGLKYGSHVGISTFVDFVIPKKFKKHVTVVAQIIILIFCIGICYYGTSLAIEQFKMNQVSPALRMPIGIVYAFIPIGMTLSIIREIQEIYKTVTGTTLN